MKIIKANNVVYEYIRRDEEGNVEGITRAVNDVSLDIEQGQFIAILGHNGSGKSTLAKHMNAILNPTEGTLWVDGMDTKDEDNIWKVRQTAGMVFQNPDNQIIGQVVEEDVGFGPENMGIPTEEIWQRVEESLRAVGMYEYRKYSPKEVAAKEVKEETGLDVLPVRLLAVMDMSKHPHPAIPYYVYKFFILCELKGGSFTETFDILGKGFFRLEELPPLSLERVLPEQIQRMYAYYKHPGEDVYLD